MIGEKLFDYEITRKIKAGGMGVVYEARRVWGKGEKVAVKFLLEQLRDDERIRRRFLREAEILETLHHPRIVKILGLDPDRDAFVMEYVEGKTLAECLRNSPQTYRQPQVVVGTFAQLLDAFDYAHHAILEIGTRREQGVVHRDIKPSNIIIEPDGSPKILDFGISRISTFESTLTDPKLQMGSVAYMSPEQIVDPGGVDWRSDIYTLGVNLWEMLAGKSPYPQVTNFDVVIQVQNSIRYEPLPRLSGLLTDIPPREHDFLDRLDEVIARSTAKDPTQRYQRCRDMRNALLATLEERSVPAEAIFSRAETPPESAPEPAEPWITLPLSPVGPAVTPVQATNETPWDQSGESATRINQPEPLEAKAAPASVRNETPWDEFGESATRINEPELLQEEDTPPEIAEPPQLTPDGSFRPIVQPGASRRFRLPVSLTNRLSSWSRQPSQASGARYAVIGIIVLLGGMVWWFSGRASRPAAAATQTAGADTISFAMVVTADSCFAVGENYQYGRNKTSKDYERAVYWYQKAADFGSSIGQNNLGEMYENGQGVARDPARALALYEASAKQGNAEGQANLGDLYRTGLGIPPDFAKALKWYRASAEQGNAKGQVSLGDMYRHGYGTTTDKQEALKWYLKAANQDFPPAQFEVGSMHELGLGTPPSLTKAVQWYQVAARQGDVPAQEALLRLNQNWVKP